MCIEYNCNILYYEDHQMTSNVLITNIIQNRRLIANHTCNEPLSLQHHNNYSFPLVIGVVAVPAIG